MALPSPNSLDVLSAKWWAGNIVNNNAMITPVVFNCGGIRATLR